MQEVDPAGDLKAEFGPGEYEKLRAKFAQVEDPPPGERDPESDTPDTKVNGEE